VHLTPEELGLLQQKYPKKKDKKRKRSAKNDKKGKTTKPKKAKKPKKLGDNSTDQPVADPMDTIDVQAKKETPNPNPEVMVRLW